MPAILSGPIRLFPHDSSVLLTDSGVTIASSAARMQAPVSEKRAKGSHADCRSWGSAFVVRARHREWSLPSPIRRVLSCSAWRPTRCGALGSATSSAMTQSRRRSRLAPSGRPRKFTSCEIRRSVESMLWPVHSSSHVPGYAGIARRRTWAPTIAESKHAVALMPTR